MPSGDEVTGLHAFDELDPVSTVSALNLMPPDEPPPGPPAIKRTLPPSGLPPRPSTRTSAPPPPPRSTRPPAALGRTLPPARPVSAAPMLAPPPPRGGFGGVSVPPAPPLRSSVPPALPPRPSAPPAASFAQSDPDDDDGETRVVPNALEAAGASARGTFDTFDESDGGLAALPDVEEPGTLPAPVAAVGAPKAIDDTALLELSATTHATDIDMEWDEEEMKTVLRDEPIPGSPGNPSPFGAPASTLRPSSASNPFGAPVRSSFPPPVPRASDAVWEDEDEAMTRVRDQAFGSLAPAGASATSWTGFPAPGGFDEGSALDEGLEPAEPSRRRWTWAVLAAAAVIGAAIAARTLLDSEPRMATVTLITKPAEAEVTIDGRALVGQTSPFMVQDLAPGVDHEIVVRKEGYEPQTHRFRATLGEVTALPGVELTKLDAGTGFAIASAPAGAKVFVDGERQEGLTPVRITNLEAGLHTVRIEHPDGHKPWETQVALANGQVIELPVAQLAGTGVLASKQEKASSARAVKDDEPESKQTIATRSSRTKSSKARRGSSRTAAPRPEPRVASARKAPVVAPRAAKPVPVVAAARPAPAPAPKPVEVASAGSGGALRVNSRPWSQVYVNGRLVGNTPLLNLPLPAGKHKVKLVNPELGMSKQMSVQIQKGKATTKVVELQ